MKPNRILYIILAILIILGLWVGVSYNRFVREEENVNLKWAEVENVYQRRTSLIPNLVEVVKGLASFEQSTFTQIAEARAQTASVRLQGDSSDASRVKTQLAVQDSIAAATNRLLISVERYPALKGTKAFSGLQTQLEGTERRIKVARKDFNEAVASYNNSVRGFPSNIAANLLGFEPMQGFESVPGAEKSIEIKFN